MAWCCDGAVRLTNQDVLRELVALLLTDETVARRLRARLIDVGTDPSMH